MATAEGRERSNQNLRPILSSEQASAMAQRSAEVRREKRRQAEELALRDLVPLSLRAQHKALTDYLNGNGEANPALRAADSVQDREWGKATQRIEQTGDEQHARLAALTPAERAELRVELLRRLEVETRDPRPAAGELEAGPQ